MKHVTVRQDETVRAITNRTGAARFRFVGRCAVDVVCTDVHYRSARPSPTTSDTVFGIAIQQLVIAR